MTANQIMLPICIAIAIVVIVLFYRLRGEKPRQTHRPHSPSNTGHDKGAIARSTLSGLAGRDR